MKPNDGQDALSILVSDVRKSSKYREVSIDLVSDIGARELTKRATLHDAIKATRNKLHQVGGAYLPQRIDYTGWREELGAAVKLDDRSVFIEACRSMMRSHASTRERLPIVEEFYRVILGELPPITSMLDIACGLNALALPLLPLSSAIRYYGCDIYQDMIDFLNAFLRVANIEGNVSLHDVILSHPEEAVDVALLLKVLPCLEQVDKEAGYRLLRTLNAKYLVVSFPVHSLGGRHKGMAQYYDTHFRTLVAAEGWTIKRIDFATEMVFLVEK